MARQLALTLTPELETLINKTVAEKVKRNGVYITRNQFLVEELTILLTDMLEEWEAISK